MDCDLCKLAAGNDGFILILCRTCKTPMVVSREHRREFTPAEKGRIRQLFPGKKIRWDMRTVQHPHCHIEGKES